MKFFLNTYERELGGMQSVNENYYKMFIWKRMKAAQSLCKIYFLKK